MAFTIKKGDTLPDLNATLTTGVDAASQSAVDLTTATQVILVIRPTSGGSATRLTGAIVSAGAGTVKYVWQAGDTATSGQYNAEWEVTFGAGKIQTFPNDSYFSITISDDLG